MAKKLADLSKGEMVVASALWRRGSATLGELFEEIREVDPMEYATVQSYIRRLEAKGYVKSRKEGRNKRYRPAIKPETVIGQTIDRMMTQLLAGESMPVFRHMIQERDIKASELEALKQMIEEAERASAERDGND